MYLMTGSPNETHQCSVLHSQILKFILTVFVLAYITGIENKLKANSSAHRYRDQRKTTTVEISKLIICCPMCGSGVWSLG